MCEWDIPHIEFAKQRWNDAKCQKGFSFFSEGNSLWRKNPTREKDTITKASHCTLHSVASVASHEIHCKLARVRLIFNVTHSWAFTRYEYAIASCGYFFERKNATFRPTEYKNLNGRIRKMNFFQKNVELSIRILNSVIRSSIRYVTRCTVSLPPQLASTLSPWNTHFTQIFTRKFD